MNVNRSWSSHFTVITTEREINKAPVVLANIHLMLTLDTFHIEAVSYVVGYRFRAHTIIMACIVCSMCLCQCRTSREPNSVIMHQHGWLHVLLQCHETLKDVF